MQQKLLLGILCGLFSVPLAYAADQNPPDTPKTVDPKPVKLDTANTLFRIRIHKNVKGKSPNFREYAAQESDQDIQANPGTTFGVIGKEVIPVSKQTASDPVPYYVVVPVDFDKNVNCPKDSQATDSQATVNTCEKNSNIHRDQAYRVKTKEIDEGESYGVVRESLVSGMFIAPFKYYPRTHSFATTSLTIAPYVGYETNVSTFTAVCQFLSNKVLSNKLRDDCADMN